MKLSLFIKIYAAKAKGQPCGSFFEVEIEDPIPSQLCQLANMWTEDFESKLDKVGTVSIVINDYQPIIKQFNGLADLRFKIAKIIPDEEVKTIGERLSALTIAPVPAAALVRAPEVRLQATEHIQKGSRPHVLRSTPTGISINTMLKELRDLFGTSINVVNERGGKSNALGTIKLGKVITTAARVIKSPVGYKMVSIPADWKNGQYLLVFDEFEHITGNRYTLYTKESMQQAKQFSFNTFVAKHKYHLKPFIPTIKRFNEMAAAS